MTDIIPIILSGGSGTRLWPISRKMLPKPFMEVAGKPLLQYALENAALVSDEALIITNKSYYHMTEKLVETSRQSPKIKYLLEPMVRNTAPAIALAVREIQATYGDNVLCLVLAADHLISGNIAFQKSIKKASYHAQQGNLVVFGVCPTSPETGYGYLEVEALSDEPQILKNFIEKPNLEKAEKYFSEGRYYWNSGMFCFNSGVMAEHIASLASDVWDASEKTFIESNQMENVREFFEESFAVQPDISIDYAVMEKAESLLMVPAGFGWSDVGSWDSVAKVTEVDVNGNSANGIKDIHFNNVHNTHVENTNFRNKAIAVIGLNNLVIVDTPDALLVADRDHSQQVKETVDWLNSQKLSELTELPATVTRPWGTYTSIIQGNNFQVKRITVDPGQKLSLQYHNKRSEHWVLIQGKAIVQVGNEEYETEKGDYRYIPLGEKHRLTNIGEDELVLIEVQIGEYLGEDDIVRIEDIYGR